MRRDEVVKLANKSRVRAVKTAIKKCDLQCSETESLGYIQSMLGV